VVDGQLVRYSAFSDTEQRARQRYADLAVHPEVRALFRARSVLTRTIRAHLDGLGYLEVETPVLQPLYGGAAARPFITHHNTLDMPLYLRIADELYLKRLIVGGFERVYEIGHDFRNEGIDRTHNPEFTMLEFYEAFADYTTMMSRVESLLVAAAEAVRAIPIVGEKVPQLVTPFPRIEWVPSLSKAAGADVMAISDAELRTLAERIGVQKVATLSRPKVLDEMFQELVESKIDTPRGSPSASNCSRVARSWRTPSPNSTTPSTSASASRRRPRCVPPATTKRAGWTRITCARWSTACRQRVAWVSASIACSCTSRTRRTFAT
jgi:lysyl-tRNA synthetase class 2